MLPLCSVMADVWFESIFPFAFKSRPSNLPAGTKESKNLKGRKRILLTVFLIFVFFNVYKKKRKKGEVERVKLNEKDWSIFPEKGNCYHETRTYPHKMADVSCLMDKTTQILLSPCWYGGVWLVLPTSMYMKIESNLALSPSSQRKRMPATMLSDIYNYFTSTMTLSGDRTLCPFLIRHYYCTISADILKKNERN